MGLTLIFHLQATNVNNVCTNVNFGHFPVDNM